MVPITLDFYELKTKVKKEIRRRIEEISTEDHPVDFSWLLYALQLEKDDPMSLEKMKELKRWTYSENSGRKDRDLAALSICLYFLKEAEKVENLEEIIKKIHTLIGKNISRPIIKKPNVLNDPGQMFSLSLVANLLVDSYREKLVEIATKNINGSISRKVLFVAAALNFGSDPRELKKVIEVEKPPDRIEDIIILLWFFEKYRYYFEFDEEITKCWIKFGKIHFQAEDEEGNFLLSNRDLALLYEAILSELKEPNPILIFNIYPFNYELRKISEDYFRNKKYSTAVFQAIQKLKEFIEMKSGIQEVSEVNLVRKTMNPKKVEGPKFVEKSPEEIVIQFNEYLDQTSGKNEQEGLASIAEGIFKALRHPRGHNPEDHPLVELSPYEALAQLIFIDYLWKRIERANVRKP